jgi:hypothetical protein
MTSAFHGSDAPLHITMKLGNANSTMTYPLLDVLGVLKNVQG